MPENINNSRRSFSKGEEFVIPLSNFLPSRISWLYMGCVNTRGKTKKKKAEKRGGKAVLKCPAYEGRS